MDKIFLTILNMSLTGAFVITVISLVRLPLKKAPKIISYCLWTVAAFRLIIPISTGSIFSLIPFKAQVIPPDIGFQQEPRINSGISHLNKIVSDMLPGAAPQASVNPLQNWITAAGMVWIIGTLGLLIYGLISYLKLKKHLQEAVLLHSNIYESESVSSPFVLGFVTPKIYLPTGLSPKEHQYIILHEQTHIRRHDHLVKLAAYVILSLHWFNPLVWAAFLLMGADMEMSCDECVLKELGSDIKKDYSYSMLALASNRQIIGRSPLAFSEGGLKERIKNVLNFKKPSRLIVIVSVAAAAILSIGFAVNQAMQHSENPVNSSGSVVTARTYYLENLTEIQQIEKLSSITLYDNGKAILATPPISSYLLPDCTYRMVGKELIIYANIAAEEEDFFGMPDETELARFQVHDNILTFQSAAVPVYAKKGMQYVLMQTLPIPVSDFKPRQWIADHSGEQEFPNSPKELILDEFPGITFRWAQDMVTATNTSSENVLIRGMPIWNVYLADLNGDGLPEFCANASIGSGIIDDTLTLFGIERAEDSQ